MTAAIHPCRALTWAEFTVEAAARFGPDPAAWAYTCPTCGDIATGAEFPEGAREKAGRECIGRHLGGPKGPERREAGGRGCAYVAYGYFEAPWEITHEDGRITHWFPLAPAPAHTTETKARP